MRRYLEKLNYSPITHNHPEGIKGAQATAAAIFLARNGSSKDDIRRYITETFGYNLTRTCDQIRPDYTFDVTCQRSVPEAIICFLESTDFESAVRLAVSLGGDSDTQACIAGGIAEGFYGVPLWIEEKAMTYLDLDFWWNSKEWLLAIPLQYLRWIAEYVDCTAFTQIQGWFHNGEF